MKDKYKRLVRFLNYLIIIGTLTAVFAYVWYTHFADNKDILLKPFFRRGNYALIGLYSVIAFLFYRVFGATKIGHMRLLEAAYTQILSVLCINAVTYLQLCLIGHWKFGSNLRPILWMTLADVILVLLWAVIAKIGYAKLFPPRKLLVVYGSYSPKSLVRKLDLMYIERYSFWLDLKLILLTVKILFQKERTEGIKSWQTSAASDDDLEKIGRE